MCRTKLIKRLQFLLQLHLFLELFLDFETVEALQFSLVGGIEGLYLLDDKAFLYLKIPELCFQLGDEFFQAVGGKILEEKCEAGYFCLMRVSNVEPPHDVECGNASRQQYQEDHRPQSAKPHNNIVISRIAHQIMQVAIGDQPQSKEVAADLQLAGGILKGAAVMLSEILEVETIDAHDYAHGKDVQFEQPEVADDGSSVIFEVLLQGTLPPVRERGFGVLLAAGARWLQEVGLAWHRAFLVVEGEGEVGRVFVGLVGLVAPPDGISHCFNQNISPLFLDGSWENQRGDDRGEARGKICFWFGWRRVLLLVSEISSIDLQLHILISARMSKEKEGEANRPVQKPAYSTRRNDRLVTVIDQSSSEPRVTSGRTSNQGQSAKKPKNGNKSKSPTAPEIKPRAGMRTARSPKQEDQDSNVSLRELTAKKTTKGKNPVLRGKVQEASKDEENKKEMASPIKNALKNAIDKESVYSEQVQNFIRRTKLEINEPEDKKGTNDSRKKRESESLKKEKKGQQSRQTPDRSKPSRQAQNDLRKSEKQEENELLERLDNLHFKEILSVDLNEDKSLAYQVSFISERQDNLKVVEFSDKQLKKLEKILKTEMKYDFLKEYLLSTCPQK